MGLSRSQRAELDDRRAVLFGCRVTFESGRAQAWTFQRDKWGLIGHRCPNPIAHSHPATYYVLTACGVAPA